MKSLILLISQRLTFLESEFDQVRSRPFEGSRASRYRGLLGSYGTISGIIINLTLIQQEWLRNRFISSGLETVLSHTEKI